MIDGTIGPSDGEVLARGFSLVVAFIVFLVWLLSSGKKDGETEPDYRRPSVPVDDGRKKDSSDIATVGHDSMRDTFNHHDHHQHDHTTF